MPLLLKQVYINLSSCAKTGTLHGCCAIYTHVKNFQPDIKVITIVIFKVYRTLFLYYNRNNICIFTMSCCVFVIIECFSVKKWGS